jgi:anti-sigma-K factor RskA
VVVAGLAVTAGALWKERGQLQNEVIALRGEALDLRNREVFAQARIATLTAPPEAEAFAKGTAVVVWDPEKQQGVIKLASIPRPEEGKDYRLWIVDPKHPTPISAGMVPVAANGVARVSFSPERKVRNIDKFVVSIEQEGGGPAMAGPIVLVGN